MAETGGGGVRDSDGIRVLVVRVIVLIVEGVIIGIVQDLHIPGVVAGRTQRIRGVGEKIRAVIMDFL